MVRKPVAFLATAKADEARRFYTDVLGLTLIEDHPFLLVFEAHGVLLRIQKVKEVVVLPYTAFGFDVTDIEAAVDALAQKGVAGERYPGFEQDTRAIWTAPSGTRVFWFKDPDGATLSYSQVPG